MDYDFYHDESLVAGYWHGMLLVPSNTRENLLTHLGIIRKNLNNSDPVNFKGLNKPSGKRFRSVQAWLTLGVSALAQRLKGDPLPLMTGKVGHGPTGAREFEYSTLRHKIGAKFIVFRVHGGLSELPNTIDFATKVETTIRMGLKGGMHLLGAPGSSININSFHFDGHEHLGRHIDLSNIVGRITGLREYCSFSKSLIVDDRSSDHRKQHSQNYDDCQLLQLTDVLIGAFRTVLGESKNAIQAEVSYPVVQLLERWNRGPARMKNSRWHRGYCVSQCSLENSQWQFSDLRSTEHKDGDQLSLNS
ncbi:MAG: hypothetical protein Q8P51_07350 [Ignavibacteria bacterium]|nr:hypothetical protein [Ignavibacteria bacterium]